VDKLTRREFLKVTGVVGASSLLGVNVFSAQAPEVTLLTWSHFVPGYNEELESQVTAWAESKGVKARVDFLSLPDITTKLASEAESKTGHDIVLVWNFSSALHKENLIELDDVAGELGNQYGPWMEGARFLTFLDGHWKAIPWYYQSLLGNINVEYWQQIGLSADDAAKLTWDGLLEKAKELHEIGHPVGLVVAETFDANGSLYPLLWSFGARAVDETGNVTIKSPETEAALEYAKKLFEYMPSEVLGWDDGGNNRFMLSGEGSWTPNPPSIWAVAKIKDLPIKDSLDHVPMPAGPAGQFRVGDFNNLGIWKFSPNIDLAKDLIVFLLQKENFDKQISASWGYNQPVLTAFKEHPVYRTERVLRYYEPPVEEVRPSGWPGPPNPATQIAYNLLIIPLMFVKVVTRQQSISEAIDWAETQLTRIYSSYRRG
jgi:multiple sugar transport system substrate-binding protein